MKAAYVVSAIDRAISARDSVSVMSVAVIPDIVVVRGIAVPNETLRFRGDMRIALYSVKAGGA